MILMWQKLLGMTIRGPLTPQGGVARALGDQHDRAGEAQSGMMSELSDKDRSSEISELEVMFLQPSAQDKPDEPIFMEIEAEYTLYVRLLFDVMLVLSCLVLNGFISM